MEDLVRIEDNNQFGNLTLENTVPIGDFFSTTPTPSNVPNANNDNSLKPFIKWGIVVIIVIIAILIVLKFRK